MTRVCRDSRVRPSRHRRRGWLLLEAMVALSIVVILFAGVQGAIASAGLASRAAASRSACADLARSVLGAIELGLATPETVHERVVDWPGEAPWSDPDERLGAFDESAPGGVGLRVEVETEPIVRGVTLVTVRVSDPSVRGGNATLSQAIVTGRGGRR